MQNSCLTHEMVTKVPKTAVVTVMSTLFRIKTVGWIVTKIATKYKHLSSLR